MSSINRANVQAAISEAFNTSVGTIGAITPEQESLFLHSCDGNLAELQDLLKSPAMIKIATEQRDQSTDFSVHARTNLYLMLILAARAGHAATVEFVLSFAREHLHPSGSLDDLIDRFQVIAAIDSNNIDVFQKFVDVVPACVNQDLGMNGDPLNQAVWRTTWELATPQQAVDLASFLLKNGADPNGPGGNAGGGGGCPFDCHLTGACHGAPLELISLLIQHGARVLQSGALQMAVTKERVDVLDLLLKNGADVNEKVPFTLDEGEVLDEETKRERCSESPLHIAVRSNTPKAALWLLENGADTSIRDAKGLTALDCARKSNNSAMLAELKPYL